MIQRAIDSYDLSKTFENMDVDRLIEIFNNTILIFISNFIPNKVITVYERKSKWMKGDIKINVKERTMLIENMLKYP